MSQYENEPHHPSLKPKQAFVQMLANQMQFHLVWTNPFKLCPNAADQKVTEDKKIKQELIYFTYAIFSVYSHQNIPPTLPGAMCIKNMPTVFTIMEHTKNTTPSSHVWRSINNNSKINCMLCNSPKSPWEAGKLYLPMDVAQKFC